MVLCGNIQVVAFEFGVYAQFSENLRNETEAEPVHVANRDFRTGHGRHADETAHFDHVGQERVFGAVQFAYALYLQEIGTHAVDLRPHAGQHAAKLQHVGFAGGVENDGGPFCQDGSHDDVGRSRDGCLVQKHVASPQVLPFHVESVFLLVVRDVRAQVLETGKMRVQVPAADLVAARLGYDGVADTGQERAGGHDRTAQAARLSAEVFGMQVGFVDVLGFEDESVFFGPFRLHAHGLQQFDKFEHVADKGNIMDRDPLLGQQAGADYLQCLVLGSLRDKATADPFASRDGKRTQNGLLLLNADAPPGEKPRLLSRLLFPP